MELLFAAADKLGIHLSREQAEQFAIYKEQLVEWNTKMNLTAIVNDTDIILKHFIDSISVMTALPKINKNTSIIDVGTGAGFPGIPIKIINPEIKLTLLDSLNKRINFLLHVKEALNLCDTECLHARAEDAGHDNAYRENYDVCLSRAVASLNVLAEYCIPFVKKGGVFVAMKGTDIQEEVKNAIPAIKTLGGEVTMIEDICIPFSDIKHTLIVINKLSHTPAVYPRKPDKIKLNPVK